MPLVFAIIQHYLGSAPRYLSNDLFIELELWIVSCELWAVICDLWVVSRNFSMEYSTLSNRFLHLYCARSELVWSGPPAFHTFLDGTLYVSNGFLLLHRARSVSCSVWACLVRTSCFSYRVNFSSGSYILCPFLSLDYSLGGIASILELSYLNLSSSSTWTCRRQLLELVVVSYLNLSSSSIWTCRRQLLETCRHQLLELVVVSNLNLSSSATWTYRQSFWWSLFS